MLGDNCVSEVYVNRTQWQACWRQFLVDKRETCWVPFLPLCLSSLLFFLSHSFQSFYTHFLFAQLYESELVSISAFLNFISILCMYLG